LRSSRVGRPAGRRHASRNAIWIALSVAAFVALSVVSAAGAANNPIVAPNAGQKFTPVLTPIGLSNKPTTLVVQLSGDPITVADANAASPLSQGQKDSIRSQLRSQQAPVAQQIQSLGGHVLASYQAAYNGFKVQIAASQAAQLAALPGVTGVYTLPTYKPDNVHGVPLVGGPQVWDPVNGNFHGEGIKIADIDTGIDYTHADFGGSGNPADYLAALASDTQPASPWWFGLGAPKVKGGTDLVGDAYDASATLPDGSPDPAHTTPHPDPNPLDCNSHGTHTAGTMAGFGVLSDGTRYTGLYNATTVSSNTWNVGPGMAPKADLYAVKIFGCSGSTNEVIDAIEWAVDHNMDVINMSLGSPFGATDTPDAVAATNAAKDGVIVVASSGNEGSNPYMTGDPASGSGVISAAASDPMPSLPTANLTLLKADLLSGGTLTAIDANGFTPLPAGPFHIQVIYSSPGVISLGCYGQDPPIPANTFIVVARGTCARVAKAIFGQQAGAAGVIMVNDSAGFPPYEGPITGDPDPPGPPLFGGFAYTVTIPFLGVPSGAASQLIAADGGTLTLTGSTIGNPGFGALASFSSWGPATGSSALKPNITAPGVSIFSAGMGTGIGALNDSGTSMAAPHVTGEAALVKQAHPDWRKVKYWTAAIENTADPSMVNGFSIRGAGSGFAQALPAVQTQVVALGDRDNGDLSFGFNELSRNFSDVGFIKLKNFGNSPATFSVTDALAAGSPHTTAFPSSVTVFGHGGEAIVPVRLSVPAATAGGAVIPGTGPFSDVSGEITLTPAAGSNNGVTLRVPYYMVPQAVSDVELHSINSSQLRKTGHTNATVTNSHSVAATGTADWYAWGIKDKRDHGLKSNDLKAVGAQSFPTAPAPSGDGTGLLAFAIATNHRWSNAAMDEFDIFVDVNNDGTPDYDVVEADYGALTTGSFNGVAAVAVFDLNEGGGTIHYLADAPTDSSTMVLPVDFAQLTDSTAATSLGSANPRFTYSVVATGLTDGTVDSSDTSAVFNPYSPAVSTGMFDILPPGGSATETLTVNAAEQAHSPALGWMVVSHENESNNEANFIDLPDLGSHH
jgi:minor extracellular serine protease Vpr